MTSNQKVYSVAKAALMLKTNTQDLFKKLRFAGLLYEHKSQRNLPRPLYLNAGIFTTAFRIYWAGDQPRTSERTLITESGFEYVKELLNGQQPPLKKPAINKERGNQVLKQLKETIAF